MSGNYASMSMRRDFLRRIPPLEFFPVLMQAVGPCRGGVHRLRGCVRWSPTGYGHGGPDICLGDCRRRPRGYRRKVLISFHMNPQLEVYDDLQSYQSEEMAFQQRMRNRPLREYGDPKLHGFIWNEPIEQNCSGIAMHSIRVCRRK